MGAGPDREALNTAKPPDASDGPALVRAIHAGDRAAETRLAERLMPVLRLLLRRWGLPLLLPQSRLESGLVLRDELFLETVRGQRRPTVLATAAVVAVIAPAEAAPSTLVVELRTPDEATVLARFEPVSPGRDGLLRLVLPAGEPGARVLVIRGAGGFEQRFEFDRVRE